MLYDFRTYTLKPNAVPAVEKLFEAAMSTREKYSRLGGFFHTEFGTLNQILHIWPYEDLSDMETIRKATRIDESGEWPPKGFTDYTVTMESEHFQSAPFMEDWTGKQKLGNVYELRRYTLQPGSAPEVLKRWGAKIEGRIALSPLAGCWISAGTGGQQNILHHLWPYESLEHRAQVRAESIAKGVWPPKSAEFYQRMENKVLIPAAFSPLS